MTEIWRSEITQEAHRIEEACCFTGKAHFNDATCWNNRYYWLGIPSAVLAGVSATFSSQNWDWIQGVPWIAPVTALSAAILISINTFLNPQDKVQKHKTSGEKYLALCNQSRKFRNIDLPRLEEKEAHEQFEKLFLRRDELNELSPPFSERAYRKAKKGIEGEGQANYKIDNKECSQ